MSARNLCVFCDGTGAILGETQATSLARLAYAAKHQPNQIVYYDAGVGSSNSLPPVGIWNSIKGKALKLGGLAFGDGIFQNIAEAYTFLIDHYADARTSLAADDQGAVDRIFLFGFSRGAFTARAVGGMVAMFGIIAPEHRNLVDYMVSLYFSEDKAGTSGVRQATMDKFALLFQKRPNAPRPVVHFVGTWDTVASVGMPGLSRSFSGNAVPEIKGKRFVHVRHAVSRHEYRMPFKVRLYSLEHDAHQTIEQRVFDGVHTDVGGGYEKRGLALPAQDWLAHEATAHGLQIAALERGNDEKQLGDEAFKYPAWALIGLKTRKFDQKHFSTAIGTPAIQHGDAQSIWTPLIKRRWFWGFAALFALFYYFASLAVKHCDSGYDKLSGVCSSVWINLPAMLTKPASPPLADSRMLLARIPESIGALRLGLVLELLCMLAVLMLFAVMLVHARMSWLRSIQFFAKRGDAAFRAALWITWGWFFSDLIENFCLLLGTRNWWWSPDIADRLWWLATGHGFAHVKFAALLALAAYFIASFLARVLRR
jgi:uncharacterized protein (DUF2235 family)